MRRFGVLPHLDNSQEPLFEFHLGLQIDYEESVSIQLYQVVLDESNLSLRDPPSS